MDTQKIIQFITRPEKILLGVNSKLALKLNLQPIIMRVVFVVLTLLFIPLGLLAYLGVYLVLNKMAGKMVTFALIGALLGIPFIEYPHLRDSLNISSGASTPETLGTTLSISVIPVVAMRNALIYLWRIDLGTVGSFSSFK